MFENLIAQPAARLLVDDIQANRLPPSMLFYGHEDSGKLTAALELARILSCTEGSADWTCTCQACLRHKELSHPDLLLMGPGDCISEIRAASVSLVRCKTIATRYLFIRSVRKLLLRFSSAVQDTEDTKFAKAAGYMADIEEELEELSPSRTPDDETIEKKTAQLIVLAEKLEDECMYDSIPVNQVRSVNAWSRLSPAGKKKIVIIENADRMQDSARNAFLKVLEEPSRDVVFILTTSRRGAIIPTILSRVRTYAFVDRSSADQEEVIRRVFHDEAFDGETLTTYFYRFLPVPLPIVYGASWKFIDMILGSAIDEGRRPLTAIRFALDAKRPDQAILERAGGLQGIYAMLNKCKPSIVWHLFLSRMASFMRASLRSGSVDARETEVFSRWTVLIREALDSVEIYNIGAQAALERMFQGMKDSI